jgi:hypothetical protein
MSLASSSAMPTGTSAVSNGGVDWKARLVHYRTELLIKKQLVIHRGVTSAHLGERVTVTSGTLDSAIIFITVNPVTKD